MEESKKVILSVVIFLVIVAVCISIYFLFIKEKSEDITEAPESLMETTQEPSEEEKEMLELIDVSLDESDKLIRELAKELSSHPELARWLMTKDLIRIFVAAVDNIAEGQSPRPHIRFFSTKGKFQVSKRGETFYIDPRSFKRYDLVAEVFNSIDIEGTVTLYRRSKPVIQEAYRDLGYPDKDFDKTLTKAITELLKVPAVNNLSVEKEVITYKMTNPRLERLTEAQKHLLRMGAENIQKIQEKLRELAVTLGIPEDQFPQ